jgi:hypothetical protein
MVDREKGVLFTLEKVMNGKNRNCFEKGSENQVKNRMKSEIYIDSFHNCRTEEKYR